MDKLHNSSKFPLLFLIFLLALNDTTAHAKSLSVAYLIPLTGDAAIFGNEVKRGALLAQQTLAHKNTHIDIVFEDTKCTAKDAVTGWKKLSNTKKTDFIVGPSCTGSILAVAPVALSSGKLLLSLWDAGKNVQKAGEHVYSLGFDSESEGEIIAKYMSTHGLKRASVLVEEDKFAELVLNSFEKHFFSRGGQIVSKASIAPGEQDLASIVLRLAKDKPDAYFVSPAYSGAAILKIFHKLQINSPIFGQDTFSFPDTLKAAGKAKEGLIFANAEIPRKQQQSLQLEKLYLDSFHIKPESLTFAAFGYDSLLIAAKAIDKYGRKPSTLDAISWNGVLPFKSFREGNMLRLAPSLFEIKQGKIYKIE